MTWAALRIPIALWAALTLSACAQFDRSRPVDVVDDDAVCRANGVAPGSKEYIACRKDRDVTATSEARLEKAHRNLATDMLNGR